VIGSEFAFLALGLLLGVPAGAALLAISRSRPAPTREVRLTVTHDAIPRHRAATLASDPFETDRSPAAGGPADTDRPFRDRRIEPAPAGMTGAMIRTPVRYGVGIAVRSGVDPVLAAIQGEPSTVAPDATTARPDASERASAVARGPTPRSGTDEPRTSVASVATSVALLERAVRRSAAAGSLVGTRVSTNGVRGARMTDRRPSAPREHDPMKDGTEVRATGGGDAGPLGDGGAGSASAPAATGPCADQRRVVDERCALADRLRTAAESSADALRDAQRAYDTHAANANQAATIADARAQRAAKDAAQRTFRNDRSRAGTRDEVEAAARTWLQEINRINEAAREAAGDLAREQAAAAQAMAAVERLTVDADATRVQAESAQESCQLARQVLADCEESASRQAAAHMPLAPSLAPDEAPDEVPVGAAAAAAAAARPGFVPAGTRIATEEDEDALAAAAERGRPAMVRLLAGDRDTMQRVVVALAADDVVEQRRWQLQLSELVDAIVARAIEACAFQFPLEHPFWGPFDQTQDRDVALALSSLGFRFDGLGGFADDRVPSQRELSLALGYAGLDPMRVRRWPTEEERGNLYREVKVSADEYIVGAASGLTLGELVTLLGRRADGLADLWNSWGRVRPLLIEPA
jgi:hypothetical protein